MDLSKFQAAAEQGCRLELKDPAGEPLLKDDGEPISITLVGTDSTRWRKAEDTIGDKRLKAAKSGGYKSMDDVRSDAAFMLASATVAWDGIIVDDKDWECNLENAKKLYLRFPWIREQVDSFVGDRRNFLTASSQT